VTDVQKLEATVNGMHILSKDKFNCTTCALGKMTQYRSREPDKKAKQPLDLVHCDVVGPIDPAAKGGFRYSISFIDDYSGALRVYLIRSKSDTVQAMKRYMAETARYGRIKSLRCDHGTEFTNNEFRTLLIENKIKQEFSAPHSPHQNGTVERSQIHF